MSKDKKPPEQRHQETQQIRVRAKAPLIGRKRSDPTHDDATMQADVEDLATERPRARPQAELMDDDATEVLMGPPPAGFARPTVIVRDEPPPPPPPKGGVSIMRSTIPQRSPLPSPTTAPAPRERAETALDRGATRKLVAPDEAPTTRPRPDDDDRRPTPRDPVQLVRRPAAVYDDPPTERPLPRQARPRGPMEQLGTEGAGLLAQKAKVARAEAKMSVAQHAALKPYRGLLDDRALSALDRVLAGELDARDVAAQASPKRALERVVYSPELERLTLDERVAFLKAIAQQPRELEIMRATARVLERAPWPRLASGERLMIAELLGLLKPTHAQFLADVVERPLHGKSAIEDRDLADTTLLSQLLGLVRERSLAPRIEQAGLDRTQALEYVLRTIAYPFGLPLEESAEGVLAGIELGLADVTPAEYVRLWRALITGDSSASLAGDGSIDLADMLRSRPGTRLHGTETPLRLGLESLVGLAHPRTGPNRSGLMMPGGHGLDADVTARVLGHVYGVGFTVAAGATAATRHLERLRADPHRVPPAFVTLLYDGGERLFVFDRFADERAYVRAPHGDSTKPRGARRPDPLRLVEDPLRGVESVPLAELTPMLGVALVPRT